ncbi:MAG: PH domain-containing protein [Agathobacter sp.]|nr:PH domain-containing protein [Agathobacter sp.]
MENNIKFRNHPSIILETSLRTVIAILAVFVFNLNSEIGEEGIQSGDIVFLVGVFGGVLVFMLGYQTYLWAKTYITIEENTLIVERNTLNKKRNTIGLKTVSNVNLEQNLLEMILGTCKVKLDTNSLSTADQTDVNIVLKKAEAEKFRMLVLARAEGQPVQMTGEDLSEDELLHGSISDLMLHGLFSIRIFNIIQIVGVLLFCILFYQDEGMPSLEVLIALFTFLGLTLWPTVKEFIKYLNFRIERKKDKVYLSYGLFKKVAYSVPVDKINGIKLTQTLIARMAKRYMVEIVNVGMDDDENETNTFFLPYSKLETIQNQLQQLLPEFDGVLEIKEEKQPVSIWLLSLPWLVLYLGITGVAYLLVEAYTFGASIKYGVLVASAVILIWRGINNLARFLTRGIKVDEKFLKIVDGGFAKKILFVKYDKIQYVTGRQCVIAKHFGIQKGTISLLASLKNRIHELPYFKENDMEQLKKKLI